MLALLDTETEDALILEALTKGQELRFRVASGSMFPTLHLDDLVLISAEFPAVGDIAFARIGQRWIVHRFIAERDGKIILRGDLNLSGPPDVLPKNAVHGKVVRIEKTLESKARRRGPRNLLRTARHKIQRLMVPNPDSKIRAL